jgi:hypothetical protein
VILAAPTQPTTVRADAGAAAVFESVAELGRNLERLEGIVDDYTGGDHRGARGKAG